MEYKKKYLKYKIKYLQLKKMIGGHKYDNNICELDQNNIQKIIGSDYRIWEKIDSLLNDEGKITVKDLFEITGFNEEYFKGKLLETTCGSKDPEDVPIDPEIASLLVKKISNGEKDISSPPYTLRILKNNLSSDYNISKIKEELNCLKKDKEECNIDCRWQPIDNDEKGESKDTCYRIDYDGKKRKIKIKPKYQPILGTLSE